MNAVIISIGDELLIGQTVNTNASWLGDRLTGLGVEVLEVCTVGDNREAITSAIVRAAGHADVVIASGGLGPTHDDITRETVADLLGCGLHYDHEQLARIEERFGERGIELNERSRRQALVPVAARYLTNNHGSAPGLVFKVGEIPVYVLPGVPSEFKGIFNDYIAAEIAPMAGEITRHTYLMFGVTESALADALAESIEFLGDDITLAYLPSLGGIRLRTMLHRSNPESVARYSALRHLISDRGSAWLGCDQDITLAEATGRELLRNGNTLATAESCTGGLLGELATSVPGSSRWYLGGVVVYANSAKSTLLGIDSHLIEAYGAVSAQVAEAMAIGIRNLLRSDVGVGITGIAGPDGGTQEKPVGTVCVAIASVLGVDSGMYHFGNEREFIRQRAANLALNRVRRESMAIAGANLGDDGSHQR